MDLTYRFTGWPLHSKRHAKWLHQNSLEHPDSGCMNHRRLVIGSGFVSELNAATVSSAGLQE